MNPTSKIEHPKSSIVLHPSSSIQESLGFRNWYAIYVKSRHEKSVHSEFQQKGIESSLPLITVTRQWSDRRKKVEVPLFRGYIFVNIDISKDKLNVLQTDGVVKFVTFCNKTVSIPEEQIFWLDQLLLTELNLTSETDFPLGTDVEVLFGPLKGLQGRVKQKNSKSRLVVWFDSIMQGVSVEIEPAFLSINKSKKIEVLPISRYG
jgi:transcription antitermination factor NusG